MHDLSVVKAGWKMTDIKEIQKKIILLGDGAVGKTSLIRRFVVDKFEDKYILTIGSKITAKTILIEKGEKTFKLNFQIWDILGQKGYDKLHKSTFRGTDGVLLVTDITRRTTLTSLENYWIPEVHTLVGHIPFVILANKSDLLGNSAFDEDELRKIALKFNAPYFFTSARFGDNVKIAFQSMGLSIVERRRSESIRPATYEITESEKGIMSELVDKIMDDFCSEFGKIEDAMPVLRRQFELAGVDLNNPTKEALEMVISRLEMVEKGFMQWDIAEANRTKRLKWIREIS
jgi:Ras-related protein Rab-1A